MSAQGQREIAYTKNIHIAPKIAGALRVHDYHVSFGGERQSTGQSR